jgi:hypothetical protein
MATRVPTFIVASGATDSSQLDLQIVNTGQKLVGLVIPGTIISTAVTFKVSADGTTFVALKTEAGSALSLTIASATAVGFKQDVASQLASWRYVQAIMGSTETNGAILIPVIL